MAVRLSSHLRPEAAAAGSFVATHTAPAHAPLVPEITLHLASEITPIWQATEAWLAEQGVAPPFWAFAWPGGQALARHVLDNPARVAGRRVLDFAAGGGIAAIACALAGAASVEAAEIDRLARTAIALNAGANGVAIRLPDDDLVGADCRWDLILCGDVCYEAPMTAHIMPWLGRMASQADVWLADPGRAYLPRDGLAAFARYRVPTSLELEDRTEREVTLYRLGF
jgi:predicted nicotinamide N-methyase